MAGGMEAQLPLFKQVAGKVEQNAADIDQQLKRLRGEMEATASTWQGQAAQAFRTLMQRFDDDANQIKEALHTIAQLLNTQGGAYTGQEDTGAQTFQGIPGLNQ